jgi:hypothetical protein
MMEHRWGKRLAVDIPIRVASATPFSVQHGRLANLSISGAWIPTRFNVRLCFEIQLILECPLSHDISTIAAHVVRRCESGVGIEWSELGPPVVIELLRAAAG